ncbi:hypothetical protein A6A27_30225 [Micromonospora sp. CB01531]|nr:hypothetical protein A6A27_30225 [Micromonospora sp. CB01531]
METAWLLLVLVIASLLFLARYEARRISSSGDSMWYMRQALIFTGKSPDEARIEAARQVCRDINRSQRERGIGPSCKEYQSDEISPRYIGIFDSRPGYPLFAAPFVAVLGAWTGMVAATMLLAIAAAVLAYLAVWMATGLRLAGVLAAGLLFVLPPGFWMTRLLTESGVLAGYLAVITGVMVTWRGRTKLGLSTVAVALVWLFAVRSASGMAMALTLVGASTVALLVRTPQRRPALATGGVGLLAVVAWQVLSVVLSLPGLNETIQDFATTHFARPDIAHLVSWLIDRNIAFWAEQGAAQVPHPEAVVALVFAVVVLVRRMPSVAALWIFTGLTGVAMLVAHPVATEYDRLMLPLWIPVACALGDAAALAVSWARMPDVASPELGAGPEAVVAASAFCLARCRCGVLYGTLRNKTRYRPPKRLSPGHGFTTTWANPWLSGCRRCHPARHGPGGWPAWPGWPQRWRPATDRGSRRAPPRTRARHRVPWRCRHGRSATRRCRGLGPTS